MYLHVFERLVSLARSSQGATSTHDCLTKTSACRGSICRENTITSSLDRDANVSVNGHFKSEMVPQRMVDLFKSQLAKQGWRLTQETIRGKTLLKFCKGGVAASIQPEATAGGSMHLVMRFSHRKAIMRTRVSGDRDIRWNHHGSRSVVISAINKKRHPCAMLGLLLLVAIVGAVVYLTGDRKDRCLDAGGAWSQEGKSCAFR